MKGITNWNHTPYKPLNASALCREFFICQLQPYSNGFSAAYRDSLPGSHTLLYRIRGKDEWQEIPAENSPVRVTGLQDDTDYEIMIRRNGTGETTLIRLLRTGDPIGTVINYLHPEDTVYAFSGHCLCSPSIVKLPSGRLIVSNDIYAAQQAQNLTLLFESCDNGETWQYLTELYPCFWGKLFLHKGRLVLCEEKDKLLEEYALIRLTEERLRELPEESIISCRASGYATEALVLRGGIPAAIPTEHTSLEDIILFMAKGDERK